MNKVQLVGRLTKDVECQEYGKGKEGGYFARFALAVRDGIDKDGNAITQFINCVAWRQTAEFISRYFRKGNMIGLNGSIQTRTYQDRDTGKNRTAFEVIINNAYFAESKGSVQGSNTGFSQNSYAQTSPRQTENNFPATSFSTGDLDGFSALAADDGDLPF